MFLSFAVVPAVRSPDLRPHAPAILKRLGTRLRWIGWITMGLLVATGIVNLGVWGYGWEDLTTGRIWEGSFGSALALKLSLVAAVVGLNAIHDLWFGPAATRAALANPGSPQAARARRAASWAGRATLILSIAVVAIAITFRRGLP